jgi:hypothetical protein
VTKATSATTPTCRFCGQTLQGGVECVTCYRKRIVRCPECHRGERVVPKYRREQCPKCRGERWLLLDQPRKN